MRQQRHRTTRRTTTTTGKAEASTIEHSSRTLSSSCESDADEDTTSRDFSVAWYVVGEIESEAAAERSERGEREDCDGGACVCDIGDRLSATANLCDLDEMSAIAKHDKTRQDTTRHSRVRHTATLAEQTICTVSTQHTRRSRLSSRLTPSNATDRMEIGHRR